MHRPISSVERTVAKLKAANLDPTQRARLFCGCFGADHHSSPDNNPTSVKLSAAALAESPWRLGEGSTLRPYIHTRI